MSVLERPDTLDETILEDFPSELPACEAPRHADHKWGCRDDLSAEFLVVGPCGRGKLMCRGWVTYVIVSGHYRCSFCNLSRHDISACRVVPL